LIPNPYNININITMKYALIFVATAAAHEAYHGYGANPQSSAVVESSSAVKPTGYTTIVPGYGKEPVTVTEQHQSYPTCVSAGYGGNDCAKWDEEVYVSTVIQDYDNNYATITKTEQPVTVYHTKKTITHSATPTGGYAAPTGLAPKNGTWYEMYEKIEEVPYKNLGPHALPGYPGSGLYKGDEKKQPVLVKEYKGGKWSQYEHVYVQGGAAKPEHTLVAPEPEVSTFEKPGVYTVPSKDVTVEHAITYPAEATKTAKAGETCTFGGQYVDAKETGYITGAYGAYETKVEGGKTVTETVVKHTTIYASTTGMYEVAKPTTTVYDHDTEVAYPTAKQYEAGVYHHEAKTVTVTKGGEAYTCDYEQTKKYEATATPKGGEAYPAHATSTAVHGNGYGNMPSGTPKKPVEGESKHDAYPGKPSEGDHKGPSYPQHPTEGDNKPAYPGMPTEGENKHPAYPGKPTEGENKYPSYPKMPTQGDNAYPVNGTSSSAVHSSYPASTPVAVYSMSSPNGDNSYGNTPKSTPVAIYSEPTDLRSSATPSFESSVYNAYPASTPSMTSVYVPSVPAPTPEAYKPETPAPEADKPETPAPEVYEPVTPTPEADKPETPEADKPETPEADKPETPEADKPETPEADKPETPEADKPETPEDYESETPEDYESETPSNSYEESGNSYEDSGNSYEDSGNSYEESSNSYEESSNSYATYEKRNVKASRHFIL
jgi:hypothetical protein